MAHIVPSIEFVMGVKSRMERGESLASCIEQQLRGQSDGFSLQMRRWWQGYTSGCSWDEGIKTTYQRALLKILEEGLKGAPVHQSLCQLEVEMCDEFERQWKLYLDSLPSRLSLPLLFLFFPAYVILLFGPLLNQFLLEVSL